MSIFNTFAGISKPLTRFFLFGFLFLSAFAGFILYPENAYAGQVSLAWDPPTTNVDGTPLTDLAGYKVYYGTASGSYSQNINVGNVTTYTISNLNDGTYYFAATAYDTSGKESEYSDEVSKTVQSVQQYTLTVNKAGNGSGTVTSSPSGINCGTGCTATYNSGTVVTLTASAATGSTFTGWSGGVCTGTGTCSFSLNATTTVTASFASSAANTYTITATAGAGGSISPSGAVTVSQGANKAFTITANSGYSIADVKVDGSSVGAVAAYTFSNVTANHTISATFAQNTYTVTPSAGANGSISPSTAQTVNYNATASFTVTPNSGYSVVSVTGCGGTLSGSTYTTGPITGNCTVAASFAATTYTITATAGTGGSISPSGAVTVSQGANQTFTITPDTGYSIAEVKVDGTSVGTLGTYTFKNVTANHIIDSTFTSSNARTEEWGNTPASNHPNTVEDTYINIDNNNNSTSTQLNTYTWPSGSIANATLIKWDLSAIPARSTIISATLSLYLQGFEDTGGDALYDISVHKVINVNPILSLATGYTYDGSNPWTPATGVYNNIPLAQADISLPEDINSLDKTLGYKSWNVTRMVQDWVNDNSTNYGLLLNSDPLATLDSNRLFASNEYSDASQRPKLVITYAPSIPQAYTITATAGTGGSVSPSGSVIVSQGANKTFTITANSGYSIADVKVDGASVGTGATYTFSNVAANHTIDASFTANSYTITATTGTSSGISPSGAVTVSQGGSISPSGTVTVLQGANKTFTITADSGYHVADVKVDGASVGTGATYTFSNIAANHTINASFASTAANTYTITATAGAGGSISPSGSVTVSQGSSKTFTINANSGYRIASIKVDGTWIAPFITSFTYTFVNISANHKIVAKFSRFRFR